MRESWLTPHWRGRRRIAHPVNWARFLEYDIGVAYVQTKVAHGHENRWYLYVRRFNDGDVRAIPVLAQTVHTTPVGSTQTATSAADWNNTNNEVEVIGTGARGAIGASTATSGGGAGGGAYSKIVNAVITTPGTTQYFWRIGATTATNGSVGGDSWWTLTSPGTTFPSSGTAVGAKGGAALASTTTATGGAGGALASAYASPATGSVKTSGGAGGNAGASATAGGGGGGAGGEQGNGVVGSTGPGAGGAGNAGTVNLGGAGGPAGNGAGAVGGAGTNLSTSPNAGSGGGGGGGNASGSTGGQGGLYGGGGGGGGRSNGTGGQGRQGVVVLTWIPVVTGVLLVTEPIDTASITGTVAWPPITGTMATVDSGEQYELLLHFDGADGSTAIVDSGSKGQTVTAQGAAQIDTAQSVFANQALMLPAATDYLSIDSGDYAFGIEDFCVDLRARLASATDALKLYDGGPGSLAIIYDGTALTFTSAAGAITGPALAANTNYHIAATRAGGSTRLWLDGVQKGSTLADATNYVSSAGYPRIGGSLAAIIEKGCLFHFDGENLSTTIVDTSGNGHVFTPVGTIAYISTAQGRQKFGGSCFQVGSSGTWFELDGSTDFAFGTGDFTIDFWTSLASTSGTRNLYDSRPAGNPAGAYPVIRNLSGTGLQYLVGNTAVITGTGLVFNTMYHIAVTRASGSTRLFLDGVQQGSTYADSNDYSVGANRPWCSAYNGYMDELRVVKGRAEWTADFTPPTKPWIGAADVTIAVDAWVAAVVANGGTVSDDRKAVNTKLIGTLINGGVFHKYDRLWVPAAENLASAYTDLRGLTYAYNAVNSSVFIPDAGHFATGGSYIDLIHNPSTAALQYARNSAHAATWNITHGTINTASFILSGSNTMSIFPRYTDGNMYVRVGDSGSTGTQIPTDASTVGFIFGNRSGANDKQNYHRGRVLAAWPAVASELPASQPFLLYTRVNAIASVGASFTEAEQAVAYAAFYDYIHAVAIRPQRAFVPPTLLLNFDGANGSTTFTDTSGNGHTVTATGAAAIDTAQSKFGGSSLGIPNATSYLTVTPTTDLAFGTGDFTVDFWVRPSAADSGTYWTVLDTRAAGGAAGPNLAITIQNYYVQVVVNGATQIYAGQYTLAYGNIWTHVAVTRENSVTRVFIAGRNEAPSWNDTTNYAVSAFVVGGRDSSSLVGWLDGFRVIKGTALWTRNFYVPRTPYDAFAHPVDRWIAAVGAINVSSGREAALRAFVNGCMEDGTWHLVERFWLYGGENSQSALVDLVTCDVSAAVNSPTFTPNRGYNGNGTTSYVDTTFNPHPNGNGNLNYHEAATLNGYKFHFAVWCNTNRSTTSALALAGHYVWPNDLSIAPYADNDAVTDKGMYFWDQSCRGVEAFRFAHTDVSFGWFMVDAKPEGGYAHTAYHNGVKLDRQLITYGYYAPVDAPIYVCGQYGINASSTDQCSALSYGDDMDDVQAKKYYARVRALMTAIGIS